MRRAVPDPRRRRGGLARFHRRIRVLAAVALVTLAVTGPIDGQRRVPRLATPELQLRHARDLKRGFHADRPPAPVVTLEAVVDAYDAVHRYHPTATRVRAEAAFRAGELLRSRGRADAALERFRAASRLGRGTEFEARAQLETAHVHRREGRGERALDFYLKVAGEDRALARHRDDAWLWAGRVWDERGRTRQARRAWRRVAERGESPFDRILAYDYLALSWARTPDLEAATGVLNECVQALSPLALEETRQGERVQRALLRMRVVTVLQERIAAREKLKHSKRNAEKALTGKPLFPRIFHNPIVGLVECVLSDDVPVDHSVGPARR